MFCPVSDGVVGLEHLVCGMQGGVKSREDHYCGCEAGYIPKYSQDRSLIFHGCFEKCGESKCAVGVKGEGEDKFQCRCGDDDVVCEDGKKCEDKKCVEFK